MTVNHQDERVILHHGNCLEIVKTLADNSIDSIVTDPPYELGFMGKGWDASGIAYNRELWAQCLRVLKPGGYILSFGGSRTWHRMAAAIEDAGFEIRDSIAWLYGSGFPKSLDVSKAIDKASGHVGEVIGTETVDVGMQGGKMHAGRPRELAERDIREASDAAKRWQGWGTALKPAFEPIVVGRKPLIGTVANNVLTHGTGALNIDGTRIQYASEQEKQKAIAMQSRPSLDIRGNAFNQQNLGNIENVRGDYSQGRWPANVVLDEFTAPILDEQSGMLKSGRLNTSSIKSENNIYGERPSDLTATYEPSQGGASRFFYVAKAPKKERPKIDGVAHPTVKPLSLMRWLCRLVTQPGGTILEPFAGSGTTVEAALLEGFNVVGIEMTDEYLPLVRYRIDRAYGKAHEEDVAFTDLAKPEIEDVTADVTQEDLFGGQL